MNPVPPPDPSIIPDSYHQAWQRLISGAVPQDELASLIETILSSEKVTEMVDRLQGSDVQTFIDALAAVRHHALPPPENGLIDLCFNLLVRRWITLISSHSPNGNI
jgi:hypothetical protein